MLNRFLAIISPRCLNFWAGRVYQDILKHYNHPAIWLFRSGGCQSFSGLCQPRECHFLPMAVQNVLLFFCADRPKPGNVTFLFVFYTICLLPSAFFPTPDENQPSNFEMLFAAWIAVSLDKEGTQTTMANFLNACLHRNSSLPLSILLRRNCLGFDQDSAVLGRDA